MNFTDNKYKVVFYEKTGCAGNKRQQKLLTIHGISFETRSLLDTYWDKETLSEFFNGIKKDDIINKFAPKIKSGEINIEKLSKVELIDMMCKEPILIKRPLLEIGDNKICGFDIENINRLLNSNICEEVKISTCQSSDRCITA